MEKKKVLYNLEQILDLIDSGQYKRAEEPMKKQPLSLVMARVCQAEVHVYFNRLDDAEELLWGVETESLPLVDWARYSLACGELYYWRFEFEQAWTYFNMAASVYRLSGDAFGLAKALYCLGRLQRRNGEYEAALRILMQALELIEDLKGGKKDFFNALINFNLAICAQQLGRLDEAARYYSQALPRLKKLENGRYYGFCLSSYGAFLRRIGQFEESLSTLRKAASILDATASFENLGTVMNNMALTLIRMKRFGEAEKTLREVEELLMRAGDVASISIIFETCAQLYLETGNLPRAEEYISQAIEQAELSHNKFLKAEAMITLGRLEIKRDNPPAAIEALEQVLEIGRQLNSHIFIVQAMLYLGEVWLTTSPPKAQSYLEAAKSLLEEHYDARLLSEYERISNRVKGEQVRIRITPDNELVISGIFLPSWSAAKETVERFLVKNALEQADGSLTGAGKILNITKVYVRDRKKRYGL